MFNKLRRKLAGWILGEQVAAFAPKRITQQTKLDIFNLSDAELGVLTRFHYYHIWQLSEKLAGQEKKDVNAYMKEHATLTLFRHAKELNADTYTIVQQVKLEGVSQGVWRTRIERLADDYDFGPNGTKLVKTPDGRIIEMSIKYDSAEDNELT